ncbi:MAG: DUF4199 domain-containing protein [Saprospiraceae bacterium]
MLKNSLLFGSVAGVLTIGTYLSAYYSNKPFVFAPWLIFGTYLYYVAAMYFAATRTRDMTEGPFTWREALRPAFLTFIVTNTIYYIFYYILFQSDPSLAVIQKDIMRETLPRLATPEQLKESMEELEKSDFRLTPGVAFLGWAQGAIFGFILAAAIAFGTKRDA